MTFPFSSELFGITFAIARLVKLQTVYKSSGDLVKLQILVQYVLGGSWDIAFLTSS